MTAGWKLKSSKRTSFVIGQDQFDALNTLSQHRRISASACVREAIDLYLSVNAAPRFAPMRTPPAQPERADK